MDAIELVLYLTAVSLFGPGLIYMSMPRMRVPSVAETHSAKAAA